jgi:FkbM family methyltransferase
MLIEPKELKTKFGVSPDGILHVGAHLGEESQLYIDAGWLCRVIWIEGQLELANALRITLPKDNNLILNAIVWDENDLDLDFKITNNSQSSSLLDFGNSWIYPEINVTKVNKVKTRRLDSLISDGDNIDLVVLDIQGAELKALIGLGDHINRVKYIFSEVNKKEVYKDCAQVNQIDDYLIRYGFQRIATKWIEGAGWGDALWIKTNLIKGHRINIVLYKITTLADFSRVKRKVKYEFLQIRDYFRKL